MVSFEEVLEAHQAEPEAHQAEPEAHQAEPEAHRAKPVDRLGPNRAVPVRSGPGLRPHPLEALADHLSAVSAERRPRLERRTENYPGVPQAIQRLATCW